VNKTPETATVRPVKTKKDVTQPKEIKRPVTEDLNKDFTPVKPIRLPRANKKPFDMKRFDNLQKKVKTSEKKFNKMVKTKRAKIAREQKKLEPEIKRARSERFDRSFIDGAARTALKVE